MLTSELSGMGSRSPSVSSVLSAASQSSVRKPFTGAKMFRGLNQSVTNFGRMMRTPNQSTSSITSFVDAPPTSADLSGMSSHTQPLFSISTATSQSSPWKSSIGSRMSRGLTQSVTSVGSIIRTPNYSKRSINSVVPSYGVVLLSILDLRKLIDDHRSLQSAKIVSVEGYVEHTITHRFLVLELHREDRKTIWARLERKPGGPTLRLVRTFGSAPTNDTVRAYPQCCLNFLADG